MTLSLANGYWDFRANTLPTAACRSTRSSTVAHSHRATTSVVADLLAANGFRAESATDVVRDLFHSAIAMPSEQEQPSAV
jgi:hypothetical protein